MSEIRISKNAESLAKDAADLFVKIANNALRRKYQFSVSLSGGSTPKALYLLLSSAAFRSKLDWSKVTFFLGDERNVPADDERSNFRMANETLFQPLAIDRTNFNRWKTEIADPESVASDYQAALREFAARENSFSASETESSGIPRLDLVLLGLGTDGHTASLFPHSEALKESDKLTSPNWVPQMKEHRFTMTFPIINNAANILFLVAGGEKSDTVRRVLKGKFIPEELPAQRVKPENGTLIWMMDESAATGLGE